MVAGYWRSLENSESPPQGVPQKKKRNGYDSCKTEEEEAKAAKLKLVKAIQKAKDGAWKKVCDEVEKDPWGRPYKLFMGTLSKTIPIPGLNTSEGLAP